jgi:hypothetical protein
MLVFVLAGGGLTETVYAIIKDDWEWHYRRFKKNETIKLRKKGYN